LPPEKEHCLSLTGLKDPAKNGGKKKTRVLLPNERDLNKPKEVGHPINVLREKPRRRDQGLSGLDEESDRRIPEAAGPHSSSVRERKKAF